MATRDRLVEMAARLLDQGGPEAVTLRDVARLAGVSHNAPYKHFADKEALLAAVAARELAGRRTVLVALAERDLPAGARLRVAFDDYVAWAADRPARFELTFRRWADPDLIAVGGAVRALFAGIVARAQEAGALPPGDPARLAALLHAAAHGAAGLALAAGDARPPGWELAPGTALPPAPGDLVGDLLDYLSLAAARHRR